jgi:hypothetical protein
MPEICRFLGISIRMYYRDHTPAHFHARYGDYEITVDIDTGNITGHFPPRALRAVLEWHERNQTQLKEDWLLAGQGRPLRPIPPLE